MIEINITPLFYIQLFQQWSQFFKKNEDFYNFDFLLFEYEYDTMLDRHDLTLGFFGFVICFKKNVFN